MTIYRSLSESIGVQVEKVMGKLVFSSKGPSLSHGKREAQPEDSVL